MGKAADFEATFWLGPEGDPGERGSAEQRAMAFMKDRASRKARDADPPASKD
jgi:hypothetical protein